MGSPTPAAPPVGPAGSVTAGSGGRERFKRFPYDAHVVNSRAVLASQSGAVTDWFSETVEALGYDIAATVTTEGTEHGRYYLSPGVLEDIDTTAGADDCALVAVDGTAHPGQLVDVSDRLRADDVRDRRGIVFARLAAGGSDLAEARLALHDARLDRRTAERAQRQSATRDPTGTSGRVADLDRRCQRLRDTLGTRRRAARRRSDRAHGDTDAHVVFVGSPTAGAPRLWSALTGADDRHPGPFDPARPVSDRRSLGGHRLRMTATPGLVPGDPEWYESVVPGTFAALRGADIVVVVDRSLDRLGDLCETVQSRSGATVLRALTAENDDTTGPGERQVGHATPEALESRLRSELATVCVDIALPYGDAAQALVSRLYDRRTVTSVEYGDEICLTVAVPDDAVADLRRRVREVGGSLDRNRGG